MPTFYSTLDRSPGRYMWVGHCANPAGQTHVRLYSRKLAGCHVESSKYVDVVLLHCRKVQMLQNERHAVIRICADRLVCSM